MSLMQCHECGGKVSSEAPMCPHCGAKPTLAQPVQVGARRSSAPKNRLRALLVGAVFLSIIVYQLSNLTIFGKGTSTDDQRTTAALAARTKSPEVQAAEARAAQDAATSKAKQEAEFQRAVAITRRIRDALNNPSSFELISLSKTPDGTLCFEYRGTNSFNALIRNYAVVPTAGESVTGSAETVSRQWNRRCANQPTEDLTLVRRAL